MNFLKRAGIPPPVHREGGSIGGLNSRVLLGCIRKTPLASCWTTPRTKMNRCARRNFIWDTQASRALWRPIHTFFWAASEVGLLRVNRFFPFGTKNEAQMTREELITNSGTSQNHF